MKAIRALLRDRRRSQRGSVLGGVLVMTAFIAIIAGALMTELSTNFLLSSNLLDRATNEVTLESSIELALDQMQSNAIGTGCPDLTPAVASINGRIAVPTYKGCWPDYRERRYSPIASLAGSAAFNVSGTHSDIPRASQDLYVVGGTDGNVYQFAFGTGSVISGWPYQLPGSVTGPPITLPYMSGDWDDLVTFAPLSVSGSPPPNCQSGYCVATISQEAGRGPATPCYVAASGAVTTTVAMGANLSSTFFFADSTGAVFAVNRFCSTLATNVGAGQPIVAGPFVFAGPVTGSTTTDEIYLVTPTSVLRYTDSVKSGVSQLSLAGTLALPVSGAVAAVPEKNTLPAGLAISISDGHIDLLQLQANFGMSLVATAFVGSGIQAAPSWCACPGPSTEVAVGTTNGGVFVFDANLNLVSSLPPGGASNFGALTTDSVGEWFYGGTDGYIHEIQQTAGQSVMVEVAKFGPVSGPISSSPQVGSCAPAFCVDFGTQDGTAYVLPLDARFVVISTCISTAPPACSGANPRLSARVQVGALGDPTSVHVQSWTYYSA